MVISCHGLLVAGQLPTVSYLMSLMDVFDLKVRLTSHIVLCTLQAWPLPQNILSHQQLTYMFLTNRINQRINAMHFISHDVFID